MLLSHMEMMCWLMGTLIQAIGKKQNFWHRPTRNIKRLKLRNRNILNYT